MISQMIKFKSVCVSVCAYRSLQRPGGLLPFVACVIQRVSACVPVAPSLSEASPEALDHHSCTTFTLLQVRLHLVWTHTHLFSNSFLTCHVRGPQI